jgi:hypothetical protein
MSGRSTGISALELELENDTELEARMDDEGDEGESDDGEFEAADDSEMEAEADDSELDDAELADDSELDDHEEDSELSELDDAELVEPDAHGFAERFYELSLREGESEFEIAREVDSILREMEHEYFLKGLLKKVKKVGGKFLKTAAGVVGSTLPIGNLAKIATSLMSGDMRGMLGALASTAMSVASKHPALAAAMPALKALGFGGGGSPAGAWKNWKNFTDMAKDAYGTLATKVDSEVMKPQRAQHAARSSFNSALVRASKRRHTYGRGTAGGSSINGQQRKRVITLRRGDRLIVRVR